MSYRPKIKSNDDGAVTDLALDAETVKGVDVVAELQNKGTVKSVSAGTGLSISGTASITPTVNIASGYKLLTTTEYNTLDAKVSNVQSDWNATSGLSVILNKPSIFNFTGVISTQTITIKNLETGIYLLTYNGTKKIKTAIGEVSNKELILETSTTYNNILVVSKYSYSINGHILPHIDWKLIYPYNNTTLYKGWTAQYQTAGDSDSPYWVGRVYDEQIVQEDIRMYNGAPDSSDANYYYPLYRYPVTTYDDDSGQINNEYDYLKRGPKYAGGTAVTLNGTSKSATDASFYAPTASGTSGQFLKSSGANASPTWATVTIPTKSSWNYDDVYVKYTASQSLTDTQKTQARSNIGAGTSSLVIGTTASTAAAGNHTHSTTLATDSGTATVTMIPDATYKLSTGDTNVIFKTPSDAYKIAETLRKGSEADTAVGYYKIATINHYNWNFCDFCMLVKNSYAGTTYSTIFNCSCSDSNVDLRSFKFDIISGTDISNKLAYLYTYDSSNNLIKIEVFIHATRFEHPMCYIINARLGQQLVIPTQDEFNKETPDQPDGTTMTGYATYDLAMQEWVTNKLDVGLYMKAQQAENGTIDDLFNRIRYGSGYSGSIYMSKKNSGTGSEIPAGWYNYIFSPHRHGMVISDNLAKPFYTNYTTTVSGVTCEFDENGFVTINGTSTGTVSLWLCLNTAITVSGTYHFYIYNAFNQDNSTFVRLDNNSTSAIALVRGSSTSVEIQLEAGTFSALLWIGSSGQTFDNLVIKPMLLKGDNAEYGTILLFPMTDDNRNAYRVRCASSKVSSVKVIGNVTASALGDQVTYSYSSGTLTITSK